MKRITLYSNANENMINYFYLQLLIIAYYLIAFILHLSLYVDSPQNLILSQKEKEGIQLYEKLVNKSFSVKKQKKFIHYFKPNTTLKQFGLNDDKMINKNAGIKEDSYTSIIIFLCLANFLSTFELYGPMIIYNFMVTAVGHKNIDFPEKLTDLSKETSYSEMIFYIFTSSLNVVIGGIIIELKYLGRKGSFYLANFIIIIFNLLILFNPGNFMLYSSFITIFSFMIANIVSVFNSEVFPFKVRDKYVGIAYFFLRLGAFASQIIFVEAYKVYIFLPIYLMIVLSLINSISFYMIPFETRGRSLEIKNDNG